MVKILAAAVGLTLIMIAMGHAAPDNVPTDTTPVTFTAP